MPTVKVYRYEYTDPDEFIDRAAMFWRNVRHLSEVWRTVPASFHEIADPGEVSSGSFATDAAGLAARFMSASVRKRPTSGVAAKLRDGQAARSMSQVRPPGMNAAARGRITWTSVYSPGWVSTSIDPACCLTIMS